MNENMYSLEYPTYTQQLHYSKLPQPPDPQTCFSYSPALLNISPNSNYVELNTLPPSQITARNQSNYQDQIDILNWENRAIPDLEKVIKFPDKIEMIEITSKDLSPASYCSNIDLIVPELYKNVPKEPNSFNKYDNQCFFNQNSCSQRNYDYSSCVQYDKSKYCAQKNYDVDAFKSCSFTNDTVFENNEMLSKNLTYKPSFYDNTDYNTYSFYEKPQDHQLPIQNDFFNTTANIQLDPILNPLDQQTEDSNEDSDIIVEESDEEVGNCEMQDRNYPYPKLNKCLICNLTYTPFGIQFYFLNSKSPLTMSSQKPVIDKIIELVGGVPTYKNYLCSDCLGLLNTIDHLQLKLDTFNTEFIAKYNKTCTENNTVYTDAVKENQPPKFKKNLRYKCKICKKELCLQKYFLYHLRQHKRAGSLCEHCGKIFKTRKMFLVHKQNHIDKKLCTRLKIQPYKCSNCSKMFRTNSQLKCHLNYCLGIFPFECKHQGCDKKFASSTQLKNHIKLKHDKKFVAICSICNIGFVKMSDYKNHKVTHNTEKKYSCTKCDKSYKTLSNLRFHMKMHQKNLPFSCHICNKGFIRKEYYDTHMNKHKGIRNYECTVCQRSFMCQKSLDAHSKYHEESKKITCNICGKTMVNGFKDHLRVHNNLKEFECESCDQKFNTKGTLNKHVKKKHGIVPA